MTSTSRPDVRYDRRSFLLGAGALWLTACSGENDSSSLGPTETPSAETQATSEPGTEEPAPTSESPSSGIEDAGFGELRASSFAALPVCAVLPSSAEGPFPSLELLDRRDVSEDYPGHPLRLGIRVVDEDCEPVPGARVEIWHTDASGDYSSYVDEGDGKDEGVGTTFMRGIQTANDEGILEFLTIYPGWYGGRAVHIHTKVWVGNAEVLTAQLYFDEAYTENIYQEAPYAAFGSADTPWSQDGLIGDPTKDGTGISLSAAPTSRGEGTLGLVNLGVPG